MIQGARRQIRRIAILFILTASAAVLLFPPWAYTFTRPGMAVVFSPAPRTFVFAPPKTGYNRFTHGLTLDWKRLSTELLAIGCVGGLIYSAIPLWESRGGE